MRAVRSLQAFMAAHSQPEHPAARWPAQDVPQARAAWLMNVHFQPEACWSGALTTRNDVASSSFGRRCGHDGAAAGLAQALH